MATTLQRKQPLLCNQIMHRSQKGHILAQPRHIPCAKSSGFILLQDLRGQGRLHHLLSQRGAQCGDRQGEGGGPEEKQGNAAVGLQNVLLEDAVAQLDGLVLALSGILT